MPEMPTDLPEEWHLDSGLREDMILTVHSSYFAPHTEYMGGNVVMLWLLGTDENEEPVEVRLSVGADWTTDNGQTIEHPTKRNQHINKNSIYGHWIGHCFEIPELGKLLIERGKPTNAAIWMDLILQLESRKIEFGPKVPAQERLMPVGYLGLTTDTTPTTVASTPTAPVPVPESGKKTPAEILAEVQQKEALSNGSPLYDRVLNMAKAESDFATFLAKAFDDAEVTVDEELVEQCADKENGIWAKAHS